VLSLKKRYYLLKILIIPAAINFSIIQNQFRTVQNKGSSVWIFVIPNNNKKTFRHQPKPKSKSQQR